MGNLYYYDAFISYSQAEDGKLAPVIQSALQKINAPWHGLSKPKINIFRDATNLGKSPGKLTDSIKEGIKSSNKYILLCSPRAKNSYWVNEEVEYYKLLCKEKGIDPSENIIIVVTDGNIKWNYEKKDWDLEVTNVLPAGLYGCFSDVPLWVDFKDIKRETNLDTKSTLFKNGIVRIAAFLLNKAPAEIDSIELRTRRTQKKIFTGVIAALLLLLGISLERTYRANVNEDRAIKEERRAEINADSALAAQARAVQQQRRAEINADSALAAQKRAVREQNRAEVSADSALAAQTRAVREQKRAEVNADSALIAQRRAIMQKDRAEINANIAIHEQKKTDTLNKVLEAENIALSSFVLNDSVEKINKAIAAKEKFAFHNPNNPLHISKKPSIYYALYDAYIKKYSALSKGYEFEIEKIDTLCKPIGMEKPIGDHYVYNIQYIPKNNLIIKSLDNKAVYLGSELHTNLSAVTAADYIINKSLLITGHDDGKIIKWNEQEKSGKYKQVSVLKKSAKKVLWLAQMDDNLILASTSDSLFSISGDGQVKRILSFNKENAPVSFDYCLENKLLFIGYVSGDIIFYKISRDIFNNLSTLNIPFKLVYNQEYRTIKGSVSYPAINKIKYNSKLNIVAFSTTSAKLFLYHIDPSGNPSKHYELAGIKYQQQIKDILIKDNGLITVALNNVVIKWPVPENMLIEKLKGSSVKEKITAR
jgi:hypothetical protein